MVCQQRQLQRQLQQQLLHNQTFMQTEQVYHLTTQRRLPAVLGMRNSD
jgi:hypothetical protein